MPQTTAIDGTGPVLVRVVSDGTAGMRLQALALAESLQRARPDWKCDEFTITPHPLTRAMPRLAAWLPSMPLYGSKPTNRATGAAAGGGITIGLVKHYKSNRPTDFQPYCWRSVRMDLMRSRWRLLSAVPPARVTEW